MTRSVQLRNKLHRVFSLTLIIDRIFYMSTSQKHTLRVRAAGVCESGTKADVKMRTHHLIVDEPVEQDGTNAGPNPVELLASAFVGCTNIIANKIAQDMGFSLSDLQVDVALDLDLRVLTGDPIPSVFPTVALKVSGKSDADKEKIETLKTRLAASCPISVLLRKGGSHVTETWDIKGTS